MHPYYGWPFLSDPSHPVLSAVWAVFIHGLISLVCVAPIVWRASRRALGATLAFIGGPALDLDHVIAVGSLDPSRLEHIAGGRPATHSILFGLVLTVIALLITRRKLIAWSVFAIVVSHVLFDGAGGSERWLYPLERPDAIPWLACPAGIVVLTVISEIAVRVTPPERRTRQQESNPDDAQDI